MTSPKSCTLDRNDSSLSRLSRSPYAQQEDVRLREDSRGNIEGVEYLAGLSGYSSENDFQPQPRRSPVSSVTSRNSTLKRRHGSSRRSSAANTYRPRAPGHRKSYPRRDSKSNSVSGSVRLCPSPGRRPSAQFTLSSPETSEKDESANDHEDDVDIPRLSLPECYIPQPVRSISKSPLLNRDLLRFVNHAGGRDATELEPMMFALSISEDEDGGGKGPHGEHAAAWEASLDEYRNAMSRVQDHGRAGMDNEQRRPADSEK